MKDWHLNPDWQYYVKQVFLMVGRVKSYHLEFRKGSLIAGVIPTERRLLINPDLLPVPNTSNVPLRYQGTRPWVQVLRGITAHEGGHVAFSAPKPAGDIGWLWNALEDERMEREVTRRFPELERDFAFLGDLTLERASHTRRGPWDLKNACLMWRFAHDRPDQTFEVDDPALWLNVQPLVEQAWDAAPYEVELLAQAIWDMLPRQARDTAPALDVQADGAGAGEGEAGGAGSASADESEPGSGEQDSSGAGNREAEGECPVDEGLPVPPGDEEQAGRRLREHVSPVPDFDQVLVREIAELLAPKERPGRRERSRSTGRYDYQRHQRGHERFFRKRGKPQRPVPFFLRLIIDLSASMSGVKIEGAKRLADLLVQAGELSGSMTEIWGFHTEAVLISAQGDREARQKIAHAGLGYSTRLGAALEEAFHRTPPLQGRREIMVILTDGELTDADRVRCQGLLLAEEVSARLLVPLLLQGAEQSQYVWSAVFGEAHCVTPERLPAFLRDYMEELRNPN